MADKTVTTIQLTEQQRSQIANDLGLANKMDRIPTKIVVAGLKSSDLSGGQAVGGQHSVLAALHIM
jgi:hypothetical protein